MVGVARFYCSLVLQLTYIGSIYMKVVGGGGGLD